MRVIKLILSGVLLSLASIPDRAMGQTTADRKKPDSVSATPILRQVAYVSGGTAEQTLDFYWPARIPSATVLFIHGGGLLELGERRSSDAYKNACVQLVSAGFGCATIDYRLAPSHKWPAMPNDVASAIVKVRQLVLERNGNPDHLYLFGHSSGCQLAAIVGTDQQYLTKVSLTTKQIAGIIPMGCVLDRRDAALRGTTADSIRAGFAADPGENQRYTSAEDMLLANPSKHIGSHVPRTLVLLAEDERFTPPILEQGARFVRRLRDIKVPAEIKIVPGDHMSSIATIAKPGSKTLEAVSEFLRAGRQSSR